jgi:hypothetical protein
VRTYTVAAVDAAPLLFDIARHVHDLRFDAVMIGNAAAALQGAPVTTVDFDFMFRKTPVNLRKMQALAAALRATVQRPHYTVSDLYRIVREEDGLQLDFMATIHGVRSFAGLRSRATAFQLGEVSLLVASLSDIIKSKRAARRPQDLAVLDVLEKTHEEATRPQGEAGGTPTRKRSRAR